MPTPYPESGFEQPDRMLELLGSWWSRTFAGRDILDPLIAAVTRAAHGRQQRWQEIYDSVSRQKIAPYRTEDWSQLVLVESERNSFAVSPPRYDQPGLFYDTNLRYDQAAVTTLFAFPVPTTLRNALVVTDGLSVGANSWVSGIDYIVEPNNGRILFFADPFNAPGAPIEEQLGLDGVVIDRLLPLWLFGAQYDHEDLWWQFGYVVKTRLDSSPAYKDLLNAIFDGVTEGTSADCIGRVFAALTGIELARSRETIEIVNQDFDETLIVSDRHVYRYPVDATPTVAVGDIVQAGAPLVTALQVHELNNNPSLPNLQAIATDPAVLAIGALSSLLWLNEDLPLVVDEDHPSGRTYVSWELVGFPADVTAFFTTMHAQGVESGVTIANLLDVREQIPDGEDTRAENLPSTINPMQFLLANVFRGNAVLVQIQVAEIVNSVAALHAADVLRRLLPPHVLLIVVASMSAATDQSIMNGDHTLDDATLESAAEDASETIPGSVFQMTATLRVSDGCYV